MNGRTIGRIRLDEDPVLWQAAHERAALFRWRGQGAAKGKGEVPAQERPRLLEAAAKGMQQAARVRKIFEEVDERALGAHAVQNQGKAMALGKGHLSFEDGELAGEGGDLDESGVESAFAQGSDL